MRLPFYNFCMAVTLLALPGCGRAGAECKAVDGEGLDHLVQQLMSGDQVGIKVRIEGKNWKVLGGRNGTSLLA